MAEKYNVSIIADFTDKISGNAKAATASLNGLSKKLKQTGQAMSNAGKNLSLKLTLPTIAFGTTAAMAWNKQAQAIAAVESGLKATGGTAGRTLEQLQKQASELQSKTLFGDEEILAGATAQLLTFTNITGKELDRTQQAVLDVATKLSAASGGTADLTGTAIMLGKALNDPVANLGALSRSGIQFSETQKKMIKQLVQSGKTAEAQSLILTELEKQYGGSAEAAAKAGTGGITQLKNSLGDLYEEFGKLIVESINPMIPKLKELTSKAIEFVQNNPGLIKVIGSFIAMAAALGPLLFIFGKITSIFGTMLGGIKTLAKFSKIFGKSLIFLGKYGFKSLQLLAMGFRAVAIAIMANPIALIITAVAALGAAVYLVWKYWDDITKAIGKAVEKLSKFLGMGSHDDIRKNAKAQMEAQLKTKSVKMPMSNVMNGVKNENKSEITIKVEAEKGTTSTVQGLKNTKGSSNVRVSNKSSIGRTVPAL